MALIARAAPPLNLMVVGTPVRLLIGLLASAAIDPVVPSIVTRVAPASRSTGAAVGRRRFR